MDKGHIGALVGGVAGGGLAAAVLSSKYSSIATAAAVLGGPLTATYLIGATLITSYLGHRLAEPHH